MPPLRASRGLPLGPAVGGRDRERRVECRGRRRGGRAQTGESGRGAEEAGAAQKEPDTEAGAPEPQIEHRKCDREEPGDVRQIGEGAREIQDQKRGGVEHQAERPLFGSDLQEELEQDDLFAQKVCANLATQKAAGGQVVAGHSNVPERGRGRAGVAGRAGELGVLPHVQERAESLEMALFQGTQAEADAEIADQAEGELVPVDEGGQRTDPEADSDAQEGAEAQVEEAADGEAGQAVRQRRRVDAEQNEAGLPGAVAREEARQAQEQAQADAARLQEPGRERVSGPAQDSATGAVKLLDRLSPATETRGFRQRVAARAQSPAGERLALSGESGAEQRDDEAGQAVGEHVADAPAVEYGVVLPRSDRRAAFAGIGQEHAGSQFGVVAARAGGGGSAGVLYGGAAGRGGERPGGVVDSEFWEHFGVYIELEIECPSEVDRNGKCKFE